MNGMLEGNRNQGVEKLNVAREGENYQGVEIGNGVNGENLLLGG